MEGAVSTPGEDERWLPIPTHPNYEVSSLGRWRRKYAVRDGYTPPRTTDVLGKRASMHMAAAFAVPGVNPKLIPHLDQLGVASDREIARRAGVVESTVRRARHLLSVGKAPHSSLFRKRTYEVSSLGQWRRKYVARDGPWLVEHLGICEVRSP